jgi:hypothetical protein
MLYLNSMLLFTLLLSSFSSSVAQDLPLYAACIVPIAEALGSSVPEKYMSAYFKLPCAFAKDAPFSYARKHQLILNEVVEVLKIQDQQALVQLPAVFYETKLTTKPDTTGWVHRNQLLLLERNDPLLDVFPERLTCNRNQFIQALKDTVVLIEPYYDATLDITFSAGTRFRIHAAQKNACAVRCYNPRDKQITIITLPKSHIRIHEQQDAQTQRADFVQLVQSYANQSQGPIAYVHGGVSYTKRYKNQKPGTVSFMGFSGFDWTNNEHPAAGLDCTGLVVRTAQIVGIPFFYKNSITMLRYLPEVSRPQAGDLLWIPGHIMIFSDIKEGMIVEARSYSHGYGIVQEIPISEQFAGINTIDDLVQVAHAKKPLLRCNKRGEIVEVHKEYKMLSLLN